MTLTVEHLAKLLEEVSHWVSEERGGDWDSQEVAERLLPQLGDAPPEPTLRQAAATMGWNVDVVNPWESIEAFRLYWEERIKLEREQAVGMEYAVNAATKARLVGLMDSAEAMMDGAHDVTAWRRFARRVLNAVSIGAASCARSHATSPPLPGGALTTKISAASS